jgi:hypothetical protein
MVCSIIVIIFGNTFAGFCITSGVDEFTFISLFLVCRQDINQNVSTLLDELDIPRAISAPPHLDDRWATQLVRFQFHLLEKVPFLLFSFIGYFVSLNS